MVDAIIAVVCTRNRGATILPAVRSLLASDHPAFSVLVIDQSGDHVSERALAPLLTDPRLSYRRSPGAGVSRARNQALREAGTKVVAFTDDDCEVPPGWLSAMHGELQRNPRASAVFSSVRAAPHDPSSVTIPVCEFEESRVVERLSDWKLPRGMAGALAVIREAALAIGGFDEELGPGGRFPAAEGQDLAARLLLGGHAICETNATHVIHHGGRTREESREDARLDWMGVGAACSKPLRVGELGFLHTVLHELASDAIAPALQALVSGQRPGDVWAGLHFLSGLVYGLGAPLDRESVLFRATNGPSKSASDGAEVATTVAICTRGRADHLEAAVQSVFDTTDPSTVVLIVDQTDQPQARMQELAAQGKLRYHHVPGKGVSLARNIALELSTTPIVVFIDDDCIMQPGTVAAFVDALQRSEEVGLAYGTVFAYEYETPDGFIPSHIIPREQVVRGRLGKLRDGGIGACRAVRRDIALRLGFDVRFGPGGTLSPAFEDGEFAYRVLRAGYAIAHVRDARVLHHGVRRWAEARTYSYAVFRGISAAYTIYLRQGDAVAALLVGQQALFTLRDMARLALRGRRPGGLRKLFGLAAGLKAGWDLEPRAENLGSAG